MDESVTTETNTTVEESLVTEPQIVNKPSEKLVPKALVEKANSEAAGYKKKYLETLSEAEKKDLLAEEKDARIAELERSITESKLTNGFEKFGVEKKNADKMTSAVLDADYDSFFAELSKTFEKKNSELQAEINRLQLEVTQRPDDDAATNAKKITYEDASKLPIKDFQAWCDTHPEEIPNT